MGTQRLPLGAWIHVSGQTTVCDDIDKLKHRVQRAMQYVRHAEQAPLSC